jgi:hypothetical protein
MKLLKKIGKVLFNILLFIGSIFLGAKIYEKFSYLFNNDSNDSGDNNRIDELRDGIDGSLGRVNTIVGELQGTQSEAKELNNRSEQLHTESEQLDKRAESRIDKNREFLARIRGTNNKPD